MLITPIDQSIVGDGNTTKRAIFSYITKALHFVYLNADGTIYSGAGNVSLSIYASNEDASDPSDIIAAVKLGTFTLDVNTPARIYDVVGTYNHIKVVLDSIADGKVTTFYATREA